MARLKDIADNLDRALRDVEQATERAVQKASAYVETSLAKAQTRAQGLPAWLALLADVEPRSPPFGLTPTFVGTLDVSGETLRVGRLRASTDGATEEAKRLALHDVTVGRGKAALLLGRGAAAGPARYLVLRFGPEVVTIWTELFQNEGDRLYVRDGVAVKGMSEEDLRATAQNKRAVAPGVGLMSLGSRENHLSIQTERWRAVYVGRDARGGVAAIVVDLDEGTERRPSPGG